LATTLLCLYKDRLTLVFDFERLLPGVALDIKILLRTIGHVARRKGL
jgi:hypothetical protein